jgi:hypothetical protein
MKWKASADDNMTACCGCLDGGVGYLLKHCACLPFTFGKVANITSDGEFSSLGCGCGITAGFFVGAAACGAPVLPCAVAVRRKIVAKYNLEEGYCRSILQVLCCPGASLAQMLMQVEEEEEGHVGCCGVWKDDNDRRRDTIEYADEHARSWGNSQETSAVIMKR